MATFARLVTTDGVTHALDVATAAIADDLLTRFTEEVLAVWAETGVSFQATPDVDVNHAPLRHGATVVGGVYTNP